jgi:hypothetical protein
MLNTNDLPVGAIYYSVSEEEWFAAGADENGEVYGDRDFRPIADCATLEEAKQAVLQAGDDVRGRFAHSPSRGPLRAASAHGRRADTNIHIVPRPDKPVVSTHHI